MGVDGTDRSTRPCLAKEVLSTGISLWNNSSVAAVSTSAPGIGYSRTCPACLRSVRAAVGLASVMVVQESSSSRAVAPIYEVAVGGGGTAYSEHPKTKGGIKAREFSK